MNEGAADYPLQTMINGGRGRQKIVPLESSPDRVPPHSNEAEMAVLGAMMLEKEAAGRLLLQHHGPQYSHLRLVGVWRNSIRR